MKSSARNQFLGTVVSVRRGLVNAEVVLDLGGGNQLAATVTRESVNSLGFREGAPACALIKAAHVILAMTH